MGVSKRSSTCNIDCPRTISATVISFLAIVLFVLAFSLQPAALAQTTSATLGGTVLDQSGAVVAEATVTLKNEASGDPRSTVSNAEGYFTFAAVPPASYSVTVEKKGFRAWEAKGIVLNSADKRNVSGIQLVPGLMTETVVVEASGVQITPVDTGEKSALINQHILENVAIVGQNAAEFVKIIPGVAYTGGTLNQSSYTASDEATGNGPVGNFSANGTRTAALDITSDGAHIIDPGCNCGQAMNTNADMTAELKVMTSNFGADESKGPVVISAIGKSGGQQFHGELYAYARSYHLNANDSIYKAKGLYPNGKPVLARPETKYFYPGGQIGGPVILPWTHFNRNRDKMFFFFGTEYYKQDVDNGVYQAVVPTAAMRKGDFTQTLNGKSYVSYLNGYAVSGTPNSNGFTKGLINGTRPIDPNGLALMNNYPLDNFDPSIPQSQGFNYVNGSTRYSNMHQYRARVDYNINESTKLYVSYNHQNDSRQESLDTLWTGNGQSWASPTTPYPSPLIESTRSDVVTANLTKVISPSLTNEFVFSYTYLNLPNSFQDPTKVNRAGLGLNYNLLFSHPNPGQLIFPQMTGWGDGVSNFLNSGFELNGTVYAKKTLPSVGDNVIKVWKTHTTKFGFYWERTWNSQPGNGAVNGTTVFSNWGSNGTGNAYSDMLLGQTTQYSEQNFNVVPAFRYMTTEFYGQDSWKVTRRFTLEYGIRLSHLGPWVDTTGYGFAAWYPDKYAAGIGGTASGVTFKGIEWNKSDPSTPLSGSASRTLLANPRVGFAWDIFGSGRTVLRGGYGMYHFHDEQNVQGGAYGVVRGSFSSPSLWSPTLASLTPYTNKLPAPGGVQALDPKDSEQPRTQSYSFTIAERLPWKSQLEVAYVGSKSDYLSNYNNNFDQINDIGVSSLYNATTCGSTANSDGNLKCGWLPNCDPSVTNGGPTSCDHPDGNHGNGYTTNQVTNARPLGSNYGTLKIIDHKMYSNYNSLQVSWNKQVGNLTFLTNYTFSKALGIRGEGGSATGDPTNLRNNYGSLPNNRTHIFNIAWVYQFPTLKNANGFVKQVANGWQISGITQYQSGPDLQAVGAGGYGTNFNYTAYIPAGTTFMGKTLAVPIQAGQQNAIGSPDVTMQPVLTCDPSKGLKAHQYINGACFSPFVTPGQQGNYVFPTLTGPSFVNNDLSVFKNFTWGPGENKKLQFRFSAYNFLNHPIETFVQSDPGLRLNFDSTGTLTKSAGTPGFGFATNKTGHRIIQGLIKFSF